MIAASLATAAAVAVAGLIGFVGLIVPHAVRMATGASHRQVVGLSLLFGASFLILCDVLARTVVAPGELPIGVITAMIGAPFFASCCGGPEGHDDRRARPASDPRTADLRTTDTGVHRGTTPRGPRSSATRHTRTSR